MCVCSTATTHTTINLPRPRQRLGSPDQTPKLTPIQHALGRIVVGVKGASFSCVADETFWRVCVMSSWVVWATQGHVLSASKLPSEKVGQQQGIIALSLPKPATFRARARKAVGEGERACVVLQNQNPEQTVTPASAERWWWTWSLSLSSSAAVIARLFWSNLMHHFDRRTGFFIQHFLLSSGSFVIAARLV